MCARYVAKPVLMIVRSAAVTMPPGTTRHHAGRERGTKWKAALTTVAMSVNDTRRSVHRPIRKRPSTWAVVVTTPTI